MLYCGVRLGAEAEEETPCWSTTCCIARDIPVSLKPLSGNKREKREKNKGEKRREKKNESRPITDLYQDYGH